MSFLQTKDPLSDRVDEGTKYFSDFPDALLNLVVLLTTANNPDGRTLRQPSVSRVESLSIV